MSNECKIDSIYIEFIGDESDPFRSYFNVSVTFADDAGVVAEAVALVGLEPLLEKDSETGDFRQFWQDELAMLVAEQIINDLPNHTFTPNDLVEMVCAVSDWDGDDKASADALRFVRTHTVFGHDDYGLDISFLALCPNAKVQYRYHRDSPDQWRDTPFQTKDIGWGGEAIEAVWSWLKTSELLTNAISATTDGNQSEYARLTGITGQQLRKLLSGSSGISGQTVTIAKLLLLLKAKNLLGEAKDALRNSA